MTTVIYLVVKYVQVHWPYVLTFPTVPLEHLRSNNSLFHQLTASQYFSRVSYIPNSVPDFDMNSLIRCSLNVHNMT